MNADRQLVQYVQRMRTALDGLTVDEQLAVIAQITGYILITAEKLHGKDVGEKARTTFATMLRNVCAQWRWEYRESVGGD